MHKCLAIAKADTALLIHILNGIFITLLLNYYTIEMKLLKNVVGALNDIFN